MKSCCRIDKPGRCCVSDSVAVCAASALPGGASGSVRRGNTSKRPCDSAIHSVQQSGPHRRLRRTHDRGGCYNTSARVPHKRPDQAKPRFSPKQAVNKILLRSPTRFDLNRKGGQSGDDQKEKRGGSDKQRVLQWPTKRCRGLRHRGKFCLRAPVSDGDAKGVDRSLADGGGTSQPLAPTRGQGHAIPAGPQRTGHLEKAGLASPGSTIPPETRQALPA